MDTRLGHFGDAIALLTEATELGFRSTASELERVSTAQRRSHRLRDVRRRLEQAGALGESVRQIAGEEGVSEGEVALRQHLSRTQHDTTADREDHVGAM